MAATVAFSTDLQMIIYTTVRVVPEINISKLALLYIL